MGNIVLLDELTINKIAAGEVIERPASVIKEMVENSIDAKANNINVEIKKARVILDIKDNGIGIRKGEITKVFEKGFTGSNGRKEGKKSTGIGLYLCRKLCGKLGIGIELNSEENIGTDVKLVFPKNDYNLIE